jgi:hypothetical protein
MTARTLRRSLSRCADFERGGEIGAGELVVDERGDGSWCRALQARASSVRGR